MEHWLWMILAALFFECKGEDKVIQTTGDVIAPEGGSVTLNCKYFTSISGPNLLWYKQDGNNGPKFMLSRYKLDEGNAEAEFRERFSSRLNSSSRSVPLKIQNLQPSDSAVYYCVLRPTVTGNTRTLYRNLLKALKSFNIYNTLLRTFYQSEVVCVFLFAVVYWGKCKGEDKVIQTTGDVIAPEGGSVTLDCKYFTSTSGPNLLWYKQDGNNGPKFMLSRYKLDEGNTEAEFRERFSSRLNSSSRSVPLKIQNLQPSDSAVYYCVVRPTVTGNTRTLALKSFNIYNTLLRTFYQSEVVCVFLFAVVYWGTSFNMLSLHHCVSSLLLLYIITGFSCEELTPVQKEQSGSEDTTVTLSYKYHKPATGADVFFWYRQYPGKPPEFLISHRGTQNNSESRLLAAVSVDQTQMDLQISSAAVTDSALFYCAVRPTNVKEKTK
ncbi:uncharacterized protein [Antennarius striatus]|uniref:uncharacterized protein n=1 Tax=Antennarius striatus TaxID=241820 RepID=UPI0035AFFCBB